MYRPILTIILVVMCSFQVAQVSETDSRVMKIADSQMGLYLAKIEPGKEGDFGFTDKDDLDACVIGKPYRIIEFNNDFYYNKLEENADYINIKNKWFAPITVNHQYKVFLTVEGNPGNLSTTSIGSVALAKELQLMSLGVNESDEFYILMIPKLHADFFVHEANNSFSDARFIPLESAIAAIPSLSSYKDAYTLGEVQKIIKEALLKQDTK